MPDRKVLSPLVLVIQEINARPARYHIDIWMVGNRLEVDTGRLKVVVLVELHVDLEEPILPARVGQALNEYRQLEDIVLVDFGDGCFLVLLCIGDLLLDENVCP